MKHVITLLILATITLNITGKSEASPQQHTPKPHLKLKGDLRIRYQNEKKESSESRTRHRLRFRLGGESNLSTETKIKFGLATGGTDPRSTNQTLQDSFQTPDIRLDYAFAEHHLSNQWTLLGGKMKNPLWRPSDLLWDSDIKPDGVGVTFQNQTLGIKWTITGGYFILDERETTINDPYLVAIQPKIDLNINDTTKARFALGYYLSQNLKGTTLDHSENSNTLDSSGLEKEFSSIVISGQLDMKNQLGLPLIRPFGEIVSNTNTTSNSKGAIAGVKFGDKKVKDFGQWQSKISYRHLEADAWLDTLPDSDAYGGATNTKGIELALTYGLSETTNLGLNYYSMENINGTKDTQSLVQFDLSFKF